MRKRETGGEKKKEKKKKEIEILLLTVFADKIPRREGKRGNKKKSALTSSSFSGKRGGERAEKKGGVYKSLKAFTLHSLSSYYEGGKRGGKVGEANADLSA